MINEFWTTGLGSFLWGIISILLLVLIAYIAAHSWLVRPFITLVERVIGRPFFPYLDRLWPDGRLPGTYRKVDPDRRRQQDELAWLEAAVRRQDALDSTRRRLDDERSQAEANEGARSTRP